MVAPFIVQSTTSPVSPLRQNRSAVPSATGGFHGAWSRGAAEATAFLPRHPSREQDWEERLDEVRSREPAAEVWERAAAEGTRLGADAESLANARALAAGEAVCVTTGQQPGLFLAQGCPVGAVLAGDDLIHTAFMAVD